MRDQFFQIATINFSHEYSGELPLEGLSVAWDPASRQFASNQQLLIKPTQGGFSIFSPDPELLHNEEAVLLIRIVIKDRLFYNFTDFGAEFRPDSKVFLFSDDAESATADTLHRGAYVSVADALEKITNTNLNELLSQLDQGLVTLRDISHREVMAAEAADFLTNLAGGVFFIGDGQKEKGYYKSSRLLESSPFGLISLNCQQVYQNYKNQNPTYSKHIRFQTRNTIWRYILASNVYEKYPQLMIVDSQSKSISFTESEFEIQPAFKVRSFESESSIPLSVNSSSRFQLVETPKEGSSVMKVVVKLLPRASPEGLYPPHTKDQEFFSNIFI